MSRFPTSRLSLGLVLIVATVTRAARLGCELVYSDEAFSWRITQFPWSESVRRLAEDVHPLLHYVLARMVIGWIGDGPVAIRSLSVLAGVGAVALTYVLAIEVCAWEQGDEHQLGRGWAVLAALAMAVHALHVEGARTARMYAVATCLAVLATWLLLRAARTGRRRRWLAYGITCIPLAHTHYFAFFLFLAHVAFVALLPTRRSPARARSSAIGVGAAMVAVTASYVPWMLVLADQVDRVHRGYWIAPPTAASMAFAVNSWFFGVRDHDGTLACAAIVLFLVFSIVAFRAPNPAFLALWLVAAVPWCMAMIITWGFGRPLIQDRYLAMAGPMLLVLGALASRHIPPSIAAFVVVAYLLTPTILGGISSFWNMPDREPSIVDAVNMIDDHPADAILCPRPADLNILTYYLRQVSDRIPRVACVPLDRNEYPGQVPHLASIEERDFVQPGELRNARRLWIVNSALQLDDTDWVVEARHRFPPMRRQYEMGYQVELFVKRARPGR
ncbi:MAG: hypothetical protein FJ297_16275 [Planctomycetes bacterium]|nr:hypothetical protein [Planctomycetota bacterium]